jgi:hypothetical protein
MDQSRQKDVENICRTAMIRTVRGISRSQSWKKFTAETQRAQRRERSDIEIERFGAEGDVQAES